MWIRNLIKINHLRQIVMSLSQKHTGKVFVPWFNTAEWKEVYSLLCSDRADKNYNQALKILNIWKCRTPLLSAGVEGTLIILQALLTEEDTLSDHQLTQIYALSTMRFLNLCAANNEKQGTFFKTAIKNDLPKWLINIRHDIAHDHKLPSISVLKLGLHQCLEWIKVKYWKVQNEIISDYIVTEESKVVEIFETYIKLNLKLFSSDTEISEYENINKKLHDIGLKISINSRTGQSSTVSILEEFLSAYLNKPMNDIDKEHLSKLVIIEALLYVTPELTAEGARIIPKEFRDVWSNLLNLLFKNSFINLLFNQLLDVTNNLEFEYGTRETAALWINEFLLGLQKAQLVREELEKNQNDPRQVDKTVLDKIISNLEEKYPQYKHCLDFYPSNMLDLIDFNTLQDRILGAPNTLTLCFLENILRFNTNSENYVNDVVNVVTTFVIPNQQGIDEEIHTADNLENFIIVDVRTIKSDSEETIVVDKSSHIRNSQSTKWKRIQDTSMYKACPLGILPSQNRNKNPLVVFLN